MMCIMLAKLNAALTSTQVQYWVYVCRLYTLSQKNYFVNNSMKHWPTFIIFGMQHHKETRHK